MFIKIPFYAGGLGKTKGTEKGPDKLLEKLKELNCSEQGCKTIINEKEIKVNNSNIEESHDLITKEMKDIFDTYGCPVILGGDHSITYATFKAFNGDGLLIFDAHPDLMQPFKPSTHENYLRNLIEEGYVKAKNVILIAARDCDKEELDFIKKSGIKFFDMKKLSMEGIDEICSLIMELCRNFEKLYISIDIDSVDPAFAPGTGHVEAGGLTSRELLYLLQRLKNLKNIKAYDLVEINPDIEERLTVALGAKILNEII